MAHRHATALAHPTTRWTAAALLTSSALAATYVLSGMANDEVVADAARDLANLNWTVPGVLAALLLLAGVHFVSAAGALRAVSGRRLPMGSITHVQLAAAATNRLLPGGIGGAAVNARYLSRAGLTAGAATSAVAALAVVGGLTDALFAAGMSGLGPVVGLGGASAELSILARTGFHVGQQYQWLVGVALLVIVAVVLVRARRSALGAIAAGVRDAASHIRRLLSHPGRLALAAIASTATTVAMSAGFVLAVDIWGSAPAPLSAGALVAVYLVSTAAGGATPLPPFAFVTEVAMVGCLTLAGYTAGSALVAVLAFRAVTYWLPLPIGLASARRLRTSALL
jgi:uncharacterized membrane protein YbhN (UPF0104 family)